MTYYMYDQNNSGGKFIINDKLCHRVVIEADSKKQATSIAEDMGIYFNGCDTGIDCDCCGDRWYHPDTLEFPMHYGAEKTFNSLEEYMQYLANHFGWTVPDGRIFYANGDVKEIFTESK